MQEHERERRRSVVGASEVGLLFGLPSFGGRTLSDLWFEKKYGTVSGSKGNASTAFGHKLEPVILAEAEERLQCRIVDRQKWCVLGVNAATLDGRVEGNGAIVEAKTAGVLWRQDTSEWGDDGSDEIPESYMMQVQAQLLVTGAEAAFLAAFIGGKGFAMYSIQPQQQLKDLIVAESAAFIASLDNETPPAEPPQLATLKAIRRQPNKTIERSDELDMAFGEFERAKANSKIADDAKEIAQRNLLAMLGDAEAAEVPGGHLTYFEQPRKEFTVKASTSRFLRFAKGK